MTTDANTRDTYRDRYKPVPINWRLQGVEGLWDLLMDDNDLGKLSTAFRNQTQTFLVGVSFPITHIRIIWRGADPQLGRTDQLEVRVAKRQADSLAVVQFYRSQPYAGIVGQNNTMIIPFVDEQTDRYPEEAFMGGYIKSLSDTADPGAFLIDRVLLAGGQPPATNAIPVP